MGEMLDSVPSPDAVPQKIGDLLKAGVDGIKLYFTLPPDTAKAIIEDARKHLHIVEQFETVRLNKRIKRRVMHHDTKISNVLFDEKEGDWLWR